MGEPRNVPTPPDPRQGAAVVAHILHTNGSAHFSPGPMRPPFPLLELCHLHSSSTHCGNSSSECLTGTGTNGRYSGGEWCCIAGMSEANCDLGRSRPGG